MSKLYLRNLSARDKVWDERRSESDVVESYYDNSQFQGYSDQIARCAQTLLFGSRLALPGPKTIHLKSCFFCRVRNCPICQWRRSLTWKARIGKALPAIERDYPKARWLHLVLTVRNCELTDLRSMIEVMSAAWKRLTIVKKFPAIGYIKSLEVTRGGDGSAHPHFHVLMLVKSTYFKGTTYIKQDKWIEMWQKALRFEYGPSVRINAVKTTNGQEVMDAVREVAKYTVKGDDLIADESWLLEYTKQIHKTRTIALGGILKKYLSEQEATKEELILGDSLDDINELGAPFYIANWNKPDSQYVVREREDD